MSLVIRCATEKDYKFIAYLNLTALGYDFSDDMTYERLKYILDNTTDKVWIAECYGVMAGFIHAANYECLHMHSLKNVIALAVDERFRGKGIGRMLLSTVEAWAQENGASGVRLVSSFPRERAHQFYLSCGYSHRKNQKNFIKFF